jgi:hypothetical protein
MTTYNQGQKSTVSSSEDEAGFHLWLDKYAGNGFLKAKHFSQINHD